MKARYLVAFAVVLVLLFVVQAFVLVGDNQANKISDQANNQERNHVNSNDRNQNNNQTNPTNQSNAPSNFTKYWMKLAETAWRYFQPGVGVDATTGLHSALVNYHFFTDWDLGLYIQAIIDAEKIGILNKEGSWGASERYDKVLRFLENRELTPEGLPYWWYESGTGRRSGEGGPDHVDTGKLLVALRNLKLHRPELAKRVDYIVYQRTNYTTMCEEIDKITVFSSIYAYYIARGFAGFWPERFNSVAEKVLNNIVSAPSVKTYGVELPMSDVLCEPLLYSVFELEPDVRLSGLAKQVYLAHEARYNATGKYVAFSEGNTALGDPSFAYEWVVSSDGRTWVIKSGGVDVNITPILFYKVAVSFSAMYNTTFAVDMVGYLNENLPQPVNGYFDGIDENRRLISTVSDKTNGLVISAARYAIENSIGASP